MCCNERIYLWMPSQIYNVILDAIELQKAVITYDGDGVTRYEVEMYGLTRRYCATVWPVQQNRSRVRLDVSSDKGFDAALVEKQFALYESLMLSFRPR